MDRKTRRSDAASLALWGLGATLATLLSAQAARADDPVFLRGDSNADGRLSISDALMSRRYLFNGDLPPPCFDAADADDSAEFDLTDMVVTLTRLFLSDQQPIAAPFPEPGLDPSADSLSCSSYEVEPAEVTQDLIRIGDVTASPGDEIEVPVYLTNRVEVEAFQLVVGYDPAVFTPKKSGPFDFAGTPWQSAFNHIADDDFRSLKPYPQDGFFVVGIIPCLTDVDVTEPDGSLNYRPIPPGNDVLVLQIRGTVAADARPGTEVLLEPTNGPGGEGVRPPLYLRNEITHKGQARYLSLLPRTLPGKLAITDDITFFTRGDANADGAVNLTDPIYLLDYLFLAGEEPRCPDAADADDSGALELTDAVVILGQLFTDSAKIAEPYPSRGMDLTPDDLRSCLAGS